MSNRRGEVGWRGGKRGWWRGDGWSQLRMHARDSVRCRSRSFPHPFTTCTALTALTPARLSLYDLQTFMLHRTHIYYTSRTNYTYGVTPSDMAWSAVAPRSSSVNIVAVKPCWLATRRAVTPSLSTASTSAPWSKRRRATYQM